MVFARELCVYLYQYQKQNHKKMKGLVSTDNKATYKMGKLQQIKQNFILFNLKTKLFEVH